MASAGKTPQTEQEIQHDPPFRIEPLEDGRALVHGRFATFGPSTVEGAEKFVRRESRIASRMREEA